VLLSYPGFFMFGDGRLILSTLFFYENDEQCKGFFTENSHVRNFLATGLVMQFGLNLHLFAQQFPRFYFPTL